MRASPGHSRPNARYQQALAAPYARVRNDDGVARVVSLFADYSREPVARQVRGVYADRLFFRDGFREFDGLDTLEAYLLGGTEALRACSFSFPQIACENGDHYLRWVMRVNLRRDPEGAFEECLGLSHIRFDEAGKVIFQQDYWDPTDVLYSRIPLVGWAIRKVHQRL